MTIKDIKERIEFIKQHKHDPEAAHSLEDSLWEDVLVELSKTSKLAKEALKTRDLKFGRWCA